MAAIPFDTHAFYAELVQSGLAEKTADALTKAVTKIEQAKYDDAVTNKDLDARIKETELKIEIVRREISETKADLTKTILTVGVGVGLTQLVAIFMLFMRLTGKG